jgi:hypothetical protein
MIKILSVFLTFAALPALAQYPRTIGWNGETWMVKKSTGKVGPGPNYFSDSTNNVWVDGNNKLHLKITKSGNRWECAEVIRVISSGHGAYRFYIDSSQGTGLDALDKNAVLGLFTWNDAPDYNHRELDIEFSRWGNATDTTNAQYVVQPYSTAGNLMRFTEPPASASVHSFNWNSDGVFFKSVTGTNPDTTDPAALIASRDFTSSIPLPGGEQARINLWLFRGKAPSNQKAIEIVISKFEQK